MTDYDLASRHPGVTRAIGDCYTEAAAVCLNRHHVSPVMMTATLHGNQVECLAEWMAPDDTARRSWANDTDATEAGA